MGGSVGPTNPQTHGPTDLPSRVVHSLAMKSRFILLAALAFSGRSLTAADVPKAPTIDDLLNLKTIAGNQISPDGQAVAYGVAAADFEHDAFVTNIWIAREGAPPFQLTRGQKSAR